MKKEMVRTLLVTLFCITLLVTLTSAQVIIPKGNIKYLGSDKESEFSWQEVYLTLNENKTSGTVYVNAFADSSPIQLSLSISQTHPQIQSNRIVISTQSHFPQPGSFTTAMYSYTGSYTKFNASIPQINGKLRITFNKKTGTYTIQSLSPPKGIKFYLYNIPN
ncbi:MAG: hypothetical protein Q7S74_05680 [Nanoarchaeota archaeon]|nr:hypothetical protein [Nanoarchaeota archaeon]